MEQISLSWGRERRTYTVTGLNAAIGAMLEAEFSDVWVAGEVSGVRLAASGHFYFTLKDRDSQVRCVCFKSTARFLKCKPQDGLAVLARGRIDVYDEAGNRLAFGDGIGIDVPDVVTIENVSPGQTFIISIKSKAYLAPGDFNLQVQFAPDNDDCDDATAMPVNSTRFGATDAATLDGAPFCGTTNNTPGVWFSIRRVTSGARAPRAMRIPISRRRCWTV